MGEAALAFLGVLLDATIAGVVALWQVQLVTAREREARQALREQGSKDRRDAFQRDTILALQKAIADQVRPYEGGGDHQGGEPTAAQPGEHAGLPDQALEGAPGSSAHPSAEGSAC